MMKILVCFKTMPDFGAAGLPDLAITDQYQVDDRFIKHVFNCFDESALEIGLKLSDQFNRNEKNCDLTALTIDHGSADLFLTHLLAVQYDRAVRIQPEPDLDLRFAPDHIAAMISAYIQKYPCEIVLTGSQCSVGDNGQTGLFLAEYLGWPCISNVSHVDPGPSPGQVTIYSRMDGETIIQTIELPAVLIIGNAKESPYLRVPTLKQKLKAKAKHIQTCSCADLKLFSSKISNADTLLNICSDKPDKKCLFIKANSSREKAEKLFENHLKGGMAK